MEKMLSHHVDVDEHLVPIYAVLVLPEAKVDAAGASLRL
jgi:hypothetical protein